jgi:hypothetical protein
VYSSVSNHGSDSSHRLLCSQGSRPPSSPGTVVSSVLYPKRRHWSIETGV